MEKRDVSSGESLVLEDKPLAKSLICILKITMVQELNLEELLP